MLVLVKDTYSEYGIHKQLLTMNLKKSGKKIMEMSSKLRCKTYIISDNLY